MLEFFLRFLLLLVIALDYYAVFSKFRAVPRAIRNGEILEFEGEDCSKYLCSRVLGRFASASCVTEGMEVLDSGSDY